MFSPQNQLISVAIYLELREPIRTRQNGSLLLWLIPIICVSIIFFFLCAVLALFEKRDLVSSIGPIVLGGKAHKVSNFLTEITKRSLNDARLC